VRTTWQTPWNLDVSLTWRYFGEVENSRSSSNPLLAGVVYEVDKKFSAQNYIDLAGSYAINKNLTVRAGINNITDRDPPLSANVGAGAGNGNTYPQVYDALGRRVFMSLTAKF
jgi:outer membrane receptor protein involved in Fe transport